MDAIVTTREAFQWIEQVEANVFHNENETPENAWVAVVRAPANVIGATDHVILAFGKTFVEATSSAEDQWQDYWSTLSRWH